MRVTKVFSLEKFWCFLPKIGNTEQSKMTRCPEKYLSGDACSHSPIPYLVIHELKCECRLAHTSTANHDYFVESKRTLVLVLAGSHCPGSLQFLRVRHLTEELQARKKKNQKTSFSHMKEDCSLSTHLHSIAASPGATTETTVSYFWSNPKKGKLPMYLLYWQGWAPLTCSTASILAYLLAF